MLLENIAMCGIFVDFSRHFYGTGNSVNLLEIRIVTKALK
jgi:hypothetical protein